MFGSNQFGTDRFASSNLGEDKTTTLIDSSVHVDSVFSRITAKIFTENMTLIDTVSRTISIVINEVISLVDNIVKKFFVIFTEIISLIARIKNKLNGLSVLWTRQPKDTDTSNWSKQSKDTNTDDWVRQDKDG